MLALGLARVSPSGKARASQARMRGFESRHPLQKNLRPVFSSELRPYVAVHLETGFLLHGSRLCRPCQGYKQMSVRPCLRSSLTGFSPLPSLEVSRVFHRICPVVAIPQSRKQKSWLLCNFFAIADSFSFPRSEKEPPHSRLPTFLRPSPRLGTRQQSLIAKKIARQADFLFLGSRDRPQIGAV